jgi:hypothetical protein
MLSGAIRRVLQACNITPGGTHGWLLDAEIAQQTDLRLPDVRDCIESLSERGYVTVVRLTGNLSVEITAEGRLFLSQRERFPDEMEGDQRKNEPIRVVPKGLRSYDSMTLISS